MRMQLCWKNWGKKSAGTWPCRHRSRLNPHLLAKKGIVFGRRNLGTSPTALENFRRSFRFRKNGRHQFEGPGPPKKFSAIQLPSKENCIYFFLCFPGIVRIWLQHLKWIDWISSTTTLTFLFVSQLRKRFPSFNFAPLIWDRKKRPRRTRAVVPQCVRKSRRRASFEASEKAAACRLHRRRPRDLAAGLGEISGVGRWVERLGFPIWVEIQK